MCLFLSPVIRCVCPPKMPLFIQQHFLCDVLQPQPSAEQHYTPVNSHSSLSSNPLSPSTELNLLASAARATCQCPCSCWGSRACPRPRYEMSDHSRSAGEEQPGDRPSWCVCVGGGIAEYWACPVWSRLGNTLLFQLGGAFVVVGMCHMRTEECRASQRKPPALHDIGATLCIFAFWHDLREQLDEPEAAEKNITKLCSLSLIATLLTFLSQKKT